MYFRMDETPVWTGMVFDKTVDKAGAPKVTMKSTGHEKPRMSVRSLANSVETKLKPFLVLIDEKCESKSFNAEFKARCVTVSSSNGWMNTDLTSECNEKVLGGFSFGRRFLARDSDECNTGSSIYYVSNIYRKTIISYPLIRTRTCSYQRLRKITFSANFAYVLNG